MSQILLDRKNSPEAMSIGNIPFEFPEIIELGSGKKIYVNRDDSSQVFRIEFQFAAGSAFSRKRLDASFTNQLIASGTSKWSEKEISEKIDYYGAYFEKHLGSDEASFSLYSLKKYASDVLPVVAEILNDPVFPEHELETLRNIKKQKFLVNTEKVNFLARRELKRSLFGKDHPYGGITELKDFDALLQTDLTSFHKDFYGSDMLIMLAGNVDDELIKLVEKHFGDHDILTNHESELNAVAVQKTGKIIIDKKDAVQSAIRIGRRIFNRTHSDYPKMQVLNTVLGGYFGSRLMSNLREDKGYTYGVGSGMVSMLNDAYFFISTEVGADVTENAEKEILKELKIMRDELIPQEELNLVKNYLMGQILKSTDGVFARMNRFRTLNLFGQDEEDFQNIIRGIKSVTSEELRELANNWLQEKDLLTVVAGKS